MSAGGDSSGQNCDQKQDVDIAPEYPCPHPDTYSGPEGKAFSGCRIPLTLPWTDGHACWRDQDTTLLTHQKENPSGLAPPELFNTARVMRTKTRKGAESKWAGARGRGIEGTHSL